MGAVEFLVMFAVFFGEFDGEFEMRAMKARVGVYLPGAAPENAFEERCFATQKGNTAAARHFHYRAFNHCRRPASYTIHNVTCSNRIIGLIRKEASHSRHLIRSSGSYGVWLAGTFKSILPPSAWEHADA